MNTKLQQIFYDLRYQPVVTWITLVGTTLSIFLIMVVVMMQQVSVIPFAPESCRPRLLLGAYLHITSTDPNEQYDSSAGLSYESAKKLYGNLDGVEHTSYMMIGTETGSVKGPTEDAFEVGFRKADAEFFKIYDHQLVEGRYYTPEEADAMRPLAVITESVARRLFGTATKTGNTFLFNHEPYTVAGVIKDNSKLALTGGGDIFLPTGPNDPDMNYNEWFGSVGVSLLVKEGVDFEYVRDQVKARYAALDTELASENNKTVYHEAPFNQETIASGLGGSNVTPSSKEENRGRMVLYTLLLLVPAINLSSMLQSRLRRRVSEIGVRRAFGCTRSRIITDIIAENFIITIVGGIIGLALGIAFALTYNGLFDTVDDMGITSPTLSVLLNWRITLSALAACFILNLISAALPAWQASRLNPVNAIKA